MKRYLIAALALATAAPFAASAADGISYNYVQAGYSATHTSVGNANGWGIEGSVAVHPNVHLFAGYDRQNINNTNVDVSLTRIGAGYNQAFSDRADFVATVAYDKADSNVGVDADGYSLEAGVRGALAPKFEAYAMAGYADADDVSGEFYGRVGAQAKFNKNWGVSADVKFKDGDTLWFVGPRLTW